MRLRLIDPVTPSLLPQETVDQLAASLRGKADLDCIGIANGPVSIETETDEQRALPGTIERVREAEQSGCSAAVVACVGDVGVEEARREVSIPVIGPGEAAIGLAQTWGASYSILIAGPRGEASMTGLCKRYGAEHQLASVRWLGIPIVELQEDEEATAAALTREAERAVKSDGADTLIIGCTLTSSLESRLIAHLERAGLHANVLEPLRWSVRLALSAASYLREGSCEPWR